MSRATIWKGEGRYEIKRQVNVRMLAGDVCVLFRQLTRKAIYNT